MRLGRNPVSHVVYLVGSLHDELVVDQTSAGITDIPRSDRLSRGVSVVSTVDVPNTDPVAIKDKYPNSDQAIEISS